MKLLTKLFIGFSVFIVLSQIFSLSYFILVPSALAQEDSDAPDITGAIIRVPFWDLPAELKTFSFEPCPQECLAGDSAGTCQTKQNKTCLNIPWIAMYIGAAYRYAVVLGSILAVFMIMMGGVLYSIGGINQNMIKTGKDLISGAVVGLILLLGSYILLNTINPNFVTLKPVKIEVVKEQGMIKALNCSEAVKQGYEVDVPDWKTVNTCGQEFDIKYNGPDTTKQVAGQKCTSDSCGNTGLACIQMVETGSYQCKSVLMYGEITNLDALVLAQCGKIAQTVAGLAFDFTKYYIDELKVKYVDSNGNEQDLTDAIDIGIGKKSYYLEKKQITADNIPDSSPLLLSVGVYDGFWGITFTYNVAGKTNNLQGANEIVPVVLCEVGGVEKIFMVTKQENGGDLYINIPALTWGELKTSLAGVRWDINVAEELFDCKGGETVKKPEMTCKYAVAEKGKQGEQCKSDSDCATGLYCNTNINACAMVNAGVGTECLASKNNACASGLICSDETDDFNGMIICVAAPKSCATDTDCENIDGWTDGSCDTDNNVCDCNSDGDCAAGYICANNAGYLYGENDSCVKKP